ncbi:MAG: aspartate-semialdehyde dehydrogenase, partial [Thermodesulfobacteriota bacterium]
MSEKLYNVAVGGATGLVGNQMITCLEESNFPVKSIKMLASSRSVGKKLNFRGESFPVEEMTEESFKDVDIAFFSAGSGPSKKFAPIAAQDGCVV